MFDLLQEYAALHHRLTLPSIGTLLLERTAAKADFSNKLFYPPKEEWKLVDAADGNDEALLQFLSRSQNINPEQAKVQLENFCLNLKDQLRQSEEIKFPGIGTLRNDELGKLQLDILVADNMLLKPVMAERVIRKDETHTILVGDNEKTNLEMNELLHSLEEQQGQRWWAWAAAIFVFAIGLILYNYNNNNWSLKGSGNQQIITPAPAPAEVSAAFK